MAAPSSAAPCSDSQSAPEAEVPLVKVLYLFAGRKRHSDVAAYLKAAEAKGSIRLILKESFLHPVTLSAGHAFNGGIQVPGL